MGVLRVSLSKKLWFYSSPKDPLEVVENKYAILNKEQYLLQNLMESKEIPLENTESQRKATPTKFILPLEEDEATFENDRTNEVQVCLYFSAALTNGLLSLFLFVE